MKPFYVYVDEFQNFLTPTIAKNLDQARGFGLHLTLANQFPRQILHAGANGAQIYDSVIANARNKVVFETRGEENLRALAFDLFMGVMNPDEIKLRLDSTKVMEYRNETREIRGESKSSGSGFSTSTGSAFGSGLGGTEVFSGDELVTPFSHSASSSDFSSESESSSEIWAESTTHSRSLVPTIVPVLGKELSHVQFRTIEEQLFRAMAVLSDQEQRHGVARLVGMKAPAAIRTPTVNKMPGSAERTKRYVDSRYQNLDFALRGTDAQKQLATRAEHFVDSLINNLLKTEASTKRRLR
jgi:hypothetical protein